MLHFVCWLHYTYDALSQFFKFFFLASAHKDIKKLTKLHHAIIKGKYEKVEKIAGVLADSTRIHYQ